MTAPVEDRANVEALAAAAIASRIPDSEQNLARLALQHGRRRQGIVEKVQQILRRAWVTVDVYDDRSVEVFARQAADNVRKAQESTSQVTEAYLHQVLRTVDIPVQRRVELPERIRPADPVKVYARPAETQRFLESTDTPDAPARALKRLDVIVDDDLGLAFRETARQVIEPLPQVVGYRRILHPELSLSGPCGLCIVASDRLYYKNRLLPLHGRCRCGVLPVFDDYDPGSGINEQDLEKVYEQAGGTDAKKLKRTRPIERQHGELGPVLRLRDQNFKGPDDI